MDREPKRQWGGLRLSWMIVLNAAAAVIIAAAYFLDWWAPVIILCGSFVIIFNLVTWLIVSRNVSGPVIKLLKGILGETAELPANDSGLIGEAAKIFYELKRDNEAVNADLNKANGNLSALSERRKEMSRLLSAWAAGDYESQPEYGVLGEELFEQVNRLQTVLGNNLKEFSRLTGELAGIKSQSAGDAAKINALTNDIAKLTGLTGDTFDAIASGDFNQRYGHEYPDLAVKAASACTRAKELSDSAANIRGAFTNHARRISDISAQLASIANNGSSAAEGIGDKSHKITEQISKSAGFASKAASIAQSTKDQFQEGYNLVSEMNNTMREIDSMSGNIMNIIKSIDDISFQTQLLSLNASIEAARAGQFGKSFAVVASKVGELAGKSKESADETGTLLENMINKFHEGVTMSEKTAKIMTQFLDGLNQVIDTVEETKEGIAMQSQTAEEMLNAARAISGDSGGKYMVEDLMTAAADLEDSLRTGASVSRGYSSPAPAMAAPPKPAYQPAPSSAPKPQAVPKPMTPAPAPVKPAPAAVPPKPVTPPPKPFTAAPKPTAPSVIQKPAITTPKPAAPAFAPKPTAPAAQAAPKPLTPPPAPVKAPAFGLKTAVPSAPAADAAPAKRPPPSSKMVVSSIKPTGFDGSSEYNRKDFGKY
ncbi:MAG: methyl-accepting chemotaxis protein [Defluviitaleaceae bacterium]|nr:methyl-accepting chemotaxis protein [Defluviitaleaceae bacterium]MCL2836431.1 methyl-accepting chemotaxis protein [Defluviitaleaceae bacterium]